MEVKEIMTDRQQTNQPADQPIDGHEDSLGICSSNNDVVKETQH